MTIPPTQKAVIFYESGGQLHYKDIPVPTPKPSELLINVKYSGVCHSDIHVWKADWPVPTQFPIVGGHEGIGEVIAMGKDVKGWRIGDLAGIKWLQSTCMSCEYCENGEESSCPFAEISGCTHNGSFEQYATVDAVQAAKIPKGVNLAEVAPILCGGLTVYKALKVCNAKAGNWVAIPGAAGGLGSFAIQYAISMGFRVLAIDGGVEKGTFCKKLGAEIFIDYTTTENLVEEVNEATNGGAHAVLNLSVSEKAIELSTEYCRPCGTVVLVGVPPGGAKCVSDVFSHVVKSITIKGSAVGNRADTHEAIDYYVRGLVKPEINIVGLSELESCFEKLERGTVTGRLVVDTSY